MDIKVILLISIPILYIITLGVIYMVKTVKGESNTMSEQWGETHHPNHPYPLEHHPDSEK